MMENIMLKYSFLKPDWEKWHTVIIVCSDVYALWGLRHLLGEIGKIKLKVIPHPPEPGVSWPDPDMVIWLREKYDPLPELAGNVIRLRRSHPDTEQIVISDAIPEGIASGPELITGVRLLRGNAATELIRAAISIALANLSLQRNTSPVVLSKRLSRTQWKVLNHMALEPSFHTIAETSGRTLKQILIHKRMAMARLNINNRIELAWLLRCIRMLQLELPAVMRLMLKKIKEDIK